MEQQNNIPFHPSVQPYAQKQLAQAYKDYVMPQIEVILGLGKYHHHQMAFIIDAVACLQERWLRDDAIGKEWERMVKGTPLEGKFPSFSLVTEQGGDTVVEWNDVVTQLVTGTAPFLVLKPPVGSATMFLSIEEREYQHKLDLSHAYIREFYPVPSHQDFTMMKKAYEAWAAGGFEGADLKMIPLLELLNAIPGVVSTQSCSSHPDDGNTRFFFILAYNTHGYMTTASTYSFDCIIHELQDRNNSFTHRTAKLVAAVSLQQGLPFYYPAHIFEGELCSQKEIDETIAFLIDRIKTVFML